VGWGVWELVSNQCRTNYSHLNSNTIWSYIGWNVLILLRQLYTKLFVIKGRKGTKLSIIDNRLDFPPSLSKVNSKGYHYILKEDMIKAINLGLKSLKIC